MPRFKLTLEYDGGGYVGWQYQANGRSVQQALEEAVAGLTGETVRIHGAGRTDAGVHALGQCCHLDLTRAWPDDTLRDALNDYLRQEAIAVLEARAVPDSFDARRAARARVYLYRIVNRRSPLTLARGRAWQVGRPLDVRAMQRAAKHLVGRHDFTSFRAAQCQARSPLRTMDALTVRRAGEEVTVTARARAFLQHQVRAMVGTLVLVGEGRWRPRDVAQALAARDRSRAGPTAPARGLYLQEVIY